MSRLDKRIALIPFIQVSSTNSSYLGRSFLEMHYSEKFREVKWD